MNKDILKEVSLNDIKHRFNNGKYKEINNIIDKNEELINVNRLLHTFIGFQFEKFTSKNEQKEYYLQFHSNLLNCIIILKKLWNSDNTQYLLKDYNKKRNPYNIDETIFKNYLDMINLFYSDLTFNNTKNINNIDRIKYFNSIIGESPPNMYNNTIISMIHDLLQVKINDYFNTMLVTVNIMFTEYVENELYYEDECEMDDIYEQIILILKMISEIMLFLNLKELIINKDKIKIKYCVIERWGKGIGYVNMKKYDLSKGLDIILELSRF